MKSAIFVAALAQLALAQPAHRNRHQHHHARDVVDVVTDVDTVTATATGVVVYVNADGVPVSTSYANGGSAAVATAIPEHAVVATVSSVPAVSAVPTPVAHSSAKSAPSSSAKASSSGSPSPAGDGFGIVYSPYMGNGDCKTQDQVNQDFEQITGYGTVRIYGTDCNQVQTVNNAAKAKGMKVFAGIYDFGVSDVTSEASALASQLNNDFSNIYAVSVGNEWVNSGIAAASDVGTMVSAARTTLSQAGYSGPITSVDTFIAYQNNPELCDAVDFVAINCHPFFDIDAAPEDSGSYVQQTGIAATQAKSQCANKKIIVSESGWPNWSTIPSEQTRASAASQKAAIDSLTAAFGSEPSQLFMFTAYNDMWKTNDAYTYGAEQYWGMIGNGQSPTEY